MIGCVTEGVKTPVRWTALPALSLFSTFVALALAPLPASAEEAALSRIGEARFVVPSAENESRGQSQVLKVGSNVFANDVVRTGSDGKAGLEFVDLTRFEVGPNSSAKLDRFVFNPDQTAQEATIRVSKGVFRFISGGRSDHNTYTVTSPHATIGVRGTNYKAYVTATATYIEIFDGTVDVCSLISRICLTLNRLSGTSAAEFSETGAVSKISPEVVEHLMQEAQGNTQVGGAGVAHGGQILGLQVETKSAETEVKRTPTTDTEPTSFEISGSFNTTDLLATGIGGPFAQATDRPAPDLRRSVSPFMPPG
jgi:hypothetical protein